LRMTSATGNLSNILIELGVVVAGLAVLARLASPFGPLFDSVLPARRTRSW